ncbi:MAG TPA: hypothetical protein VF624_04905 [Tepidisphaeraceae bacterium]|jgi:hypothetical protein
MAQALGWFPGLFRAALIQLFAEHVESYPVETIAQVDSGPTTVDVPVIEVVRISEITSGSHATQCMG